MRPPRARAYRIATACLVLVLIPALLGCARSPRRRNGPVSVDDRPTPRQPDEPASGVTGPKESAGSSKENAERQTTSGSSSTAPAADAPVESVMTPEERRATLARVVADTSSAGAAVRRCGTRTLLPDQESVLDTTRNLLSQTRAALARDELWRAESLARKARQLALSLSCP